MDPEKWYKAQCDTALQAGRITLTEYRHGGIITGWPSRWPMASNKTKGKRGIIQSMSSRSMIRAGWQIANSPCDFDLMTTLTFRDASPNPKECLRQWCLDVGLNARPNIGWGWAMEYQGRGVVHYHVIHQMQQLTRDWPDMTPEWDTVTRKGHPRRILQGRMGRKLQDLWIARVGDTSSAFHRFQRGGITESSANPEATALYLGGYIGKLAQKQLPDSEVPQGRWWWLSEAARPVAGQVHVLTEYPLDRPHHLVHDKKKLLEPGTPVAPPRPKNLQPGRPPKLSYRRQPKKGVGE